jgi:diguanylate cyclase (GGDEF)-like protein
MVLATRLGGALWLIGVVYALIILPLAPPEGGWEIWAGVAACLLVSAVAGLVMVRRQTALTPACLYAAPIAGVIIATAFRWLAGPGAPFAQLLFLACLYAAAIHPPRRTILILSAVSAATFTPLIYGSTDSTFAATAVGALALDWSLAMVIVIWMTRVRGQRRDLSSARAEADALARVDALTGLGNRRALEEAVPRAVAAARRDGKPISALFADLDSFKEINDRFGHQAGDDTLRDVARAFEATCRISDPCFRWGGDEFVALLPDSDGQEAEVVAARVREAVALSCRRPDGLPVRISTGWAQLDDAETGGEMLVRADDALMAAKAARRPSRLRAS